MAQLQSDLGSQKTFMSKSDSKNANQVKSINFSVTTTQASQIIPVSELLKKSNPISLDILAVNDKTNYQVGSNLVPWPQPSNGSVTTAASEFVSQGGYQSWQADQHFHYSRATQPMHKVNSPRDIPHINP